MCKNVNKECVKKWTAYIIVRMLYPLSVFVQAILLAQYPSIYLKNKNYNFCVFLAAPTIIAVLVVILKKSDQEVKWLWLVWSFYVLLLTPMVAVIFGYLRKEIDGNKFFGPNVLKTIICASPVIALLLFTTAKDFRRNSDLVVQLIGGIALDLFDDIEVLEILLPNTGSLEHLPKGLEISIVVCVCISFLLSPLEIAENKIIGIGPEHKYRKRVYLCRLILQMLLVNLTLLIIRLVVWLQYEHDASIFITKNFIIIVVAIINIVRERCGCDEKSSGPD